MNLGKGTRRHFRRWAVLAMALWVSGVLAQSANSQSPETKGIDPALLAKAMAGDADAEVSLGALYARGHGIRQDYAQAAVWYRKAAEQGDALAQWYLGVVYTLGRGVPEDYPQAAAWYRRAADQGNASAQIGLGLLYEQGKGVPQDYSQAAVWYRKAAEQGDALAQWNLGSLYDDGHGVPQDYEEAYFWLNLAAAGKIEGVKPEDVAKKRDDAASHLTPAELTREQGRARKWFEDHQAKPQ